MSSGKGDSPMDLPDGENQSTTPALTKSAEAGIIPEEVTAQGGSGKQRVAIILLGLGLNVFLAALDIVSLPILNLNNVFEDEKAKGEKKKTIVSTALPKIIADFNASDSAYAWIASAYLLANASFVALWGRVSDIWGRKPILTLSIVLFLGGSLICGLAIHVSMLIAGRTLQGVGSGGITVLANVCVSDLFDVQRRAAYLGIFGATWAIAGAVGPVIGGAFTSYVTWRWCFYINLPVGGVALLFLVFFLRVDSNRKSLRDGLAAIDWTGICLLIGAILMLLIGLEFGGDQYPWASATVICLIVFGIVALILFGVNEWFSPVPIIPPAVFNSWQNIILLLVNFFHGAVFIGGCFYLPVYFQNILLESSIMSGVLLLPLVGALAASSGLAGWYMRATGRFREVIIFGMFFTTLGYGLYLDLKPYHSWARIVLYQMIAGVGLGPNFQATLIALQANVDPSEMSTATAAFSLVRQMAASISVVIGTVIYNHGVQLHENALAAAVGSSLAAEITAASTATSSLTKNLPTDEKNAVLRIVNEGIWYVWLLYTCLSGAGLVITCLLKNLKLQVTS
ncbi:efflux pump antibiotic resistance protein [Penicillium macrosclerotiorum]|uniref:efflux pump antibiotic resistance protein n=1 Tax=Penicillium macrosclerotiorum TaxID=303699 RepID=UPI002549794A|nr:efflux pump antibiotic resistance protein [Penicillium macrosclerotiorum]KAJ5690767.1 efflux pump antibiotic resistance protein [Penicillium macrosclerotiorum]